MTRIHTFSFGLIIVLISSIFAYNPVVATAASYNSAKLADDAAFIKTNAAGVDQIQQILRSNDSFLKDYSENGRSAAQIIYDAAHGHGDASATVNGISIRETINPIAILAVLQKEQSLITMKNKNKDALRVAMGYGCPDGGGCDSKYAGFTKQVENGSWQLRYNYERAKGQGFKDYQVGQKIKIDGKKITIANRTTAALYRYTPHLGTNFSKYFAKWNDSSALAKAAAKAKAKELAKQKALAKAKAKAEAKVKAAQKKAAAKALAKEKALAKAKAKAAAKAK